MPPATAVSGVVRRSQTRVCRTTAWCAQEHAHTPSIAAWHKYGTETAAQALAQIAACAGGRALAAVLRKLAQSLRLWFAGLPDLVLWRPKDKRREASTTAVSLSSPGAPAPGGKPGAAARGVDGDGDAPRFMLVEVKCTDHLSFQQMAWLHELNANGVPCGIAVLRLS